LEDASGARNETAVEIDEAKEALEVLHSVRLRVVEDGVHMGGHGSDAGGGDLVAEEGDRRLSKGALGEVDEEAVVSEEVEELSEVGEVLLEVGAGHQDVVEINKEEGKVLEDVVHEALEGLCRIAEAKGHGEVFVKSEGSNDGGFRNVRGVDGNLVVAFDEVQLGEDGGPVEARGKVLEVRERIAVRSGD